MKCSSIAGSAAGVCGSDKVYDSARADQYCGQATETAACTARDASVCCQDKATCSSIASSARSAFCGGDKVYAPNNAPKRCAGATCTKEADAGVCCVPKARCSTMTCAGKHQVPRADAGSWFCAGVTCNAWRDAPTCCRAKCSQFDELPSQGCDRDKEVRDDSKLCVGFPCARRDQVTCARAKPAAAAAVAAAVAAVAAVEAVPRATSQTAVPFQRTAVRAMASVALDRPFLLSWACVSSWVLPSQTRFR